LKLGAMSESKDTDLIRMICAGAGQRYGHVACEFYVPLAGECDLLKQSKIETIFEKGRCNPRGIMSSAVKRNLFKYKDLIHVKEYLSSIVFTLRNRLKNIRLKKGHSLPVLIGYINRASYTEVILALRSEGLLARKICGCCVFLTESEPSVCTRGTVPVTNDGVTELKENPFYLKERKTRDKCQEGFQSYTPLSANEEKDDDSEDTHKLPLAETLGNAASIDRSEDRIEIEELKDLLKKRAATTKHSNTKKIYKRQHNVFVSLYHYLSEGYSIPKAMQLIAAKIGKNVKTIERDLDEIRAFLSKEISYT